MKIAAGVLALVGVGIVLAPIKGYVEYVFQYALAYAYVEGIPEAKRGTC